MADTTGSGAAQPVRYAMIGGGKDAFIGAVHRMAAALDQQAVLTAGALSSTPEKAIASARELGLPSDRGYGSWEELLEKESARPEGERVDFVSIVTPNDTHFPIAKAAVEAGFHVVLDKPMVHSSAQAAELTAAVEQSGVVFAVTYNYTGYPLVRHAADMVRGGEIGEVRKVFVEYHQGWLSTKLEDTDLKQAGWRTDPARSGIAGCVGDIGTHAENLVATVTGLEIEALAADLSTFVPGRRLDDDAAVLMRYRGGAKGTLTCSQVCWGEENNLTLRVYGTKGALAWRQEEPNALRHIDADGVRRELTRGGPGLSAAAGDATRIPPGHPEAFIEAFANVYRGALDAMRGVKSSLAERFPTVHDGARGVRFIEAVVESGQKDAAWVTF
ncbi:MAG: Gfo/Idh/MocA family oxidoreductase [Planctomycetota bacterium]